MAEFNNSFNAANLPMATPDVSAAYGVNYADIPNIDLGAVQSYGSRQSSFMNPSSSIGSGIGSVLGGSLLGAGLGFINDWINRDTNIVEAAKQRDWQYDMMLEQQKYNTEMWNKNNEYNSPEAQLKRLTDLGINPATALSMMSNGNSSSPASPAGAGSGAAASSPQSSVPGMAQVGSQVPVNQQQAKQMELDNYYRPFETDMALRSGEAQIWNLTKQGLLSASEARQITEMLPLMKNKTGAEIDNLVNAAMEAAAHVDNLEKQNALLDEQTINELYNRKLISANTYESFQQALKSQSEATLNAANTEFVNGRVAMQPWELRQLKEGVFVMSYENKLRKLGINPNAPEEVQIKQYLGHIYTTDYSDSPLNASIQFQKTLWSIEAVSRGARNIFGSVKDLGIGLGGLGVGRQGLSSARSGSKTTTYGPNGNTITYSDSWTHSSSL